VGKTLLTGGTGLIGSRVAHALVQRGDDLRITVRDRSRLDGLAELDYEPVKCDVLDRRAVRRALRDVERVFHVAGSINLRAPLSEMNAINVGGTRMVLEEALRAGVQRVTVTSSAAVVGPAAPNSAADETQAFTGTHGIPYVMSNREAEVAALRIAARGLDVVLVCPTVVFGAGDLRHSSTELVRRFMLRRIPVYVDGGLNIVDVEDVAQAHLLADARGTAGERYIIGSRNFTWDRLFADLGRLSGVEPPSLKLPLPAALALARAFEALPGPTPISELEVRATSLWWTYSSRKAERELGYKSSPHEETLERTVDWYLEREGARLSHHSRRQPLGLRVAGGVTRQLGGMAGLLRG
jgi:dihydroflavonol-4-reductase